MNLYESIKNNLKESSISYKNLPEELKDELFYDGSLSTYHCEDCNSYFEEPKIKNVNMENYYSVGSLFSDSHYQTMEFCPHCDSENFDKIKIDLDDVISEYVDEPSNEQIIINKFNEVYPELANKSSNIFVDYLDEIYSLVKDYELYIDEGGED